MSPNLMRQSGSNQDGGEDLYGLVRRANRKVGFPRSASLTETTTERRRKEGGVTSAAARGGNGPRVLQSKLVPKSASTGSSPTPAMRGGAMHRESPKRLMKGMAHVRDAPAGSATSSAMVGVAAPLTKPPAKQVRFSDMIELAEFIRDDVVDSDEEEGGG